MKHQRIFHKIATLLVLAISPMFIQWKCDWFDNTPQPQPLPPTPSATASHQQELWGIINTNIKPILGNMGDARELMEVYGFETKLESTQNLYINGSHILGDDSADLNHIWYKELMRNPSIDGESDANLAKDITLKNLTRYKLVDFIKLFRNYPDVNRAFINYINSTR